MEIGEGVAVKLDSADLLAAARIRCRAPDTMLTIRLLDCPSRCRATFRRGER